MKKKKPGRKLIKPNKTTFEMMYEKLTAEEMAAKYNVTKQTIYNWASNYRKEK